MNMFSRLIKKKPKSIINWQTKQGIKEFNKKYNAPFESTITSGEENIIFSQNVCMSADFQQTMRNPHVCVIGGSGFGKTYNVVLPNLLQMDGSYIVSDPNGMLIEKTSELYKKNGYMVKVFSISSPDLSDHYNPFYYLYDELDIMSFVSCFLKNTKQTLLPGNEEDTFLKKAEASFMQVIISCLIHYKRKDMQNFATLFKLLKDQEKLDSLFETTAKENPDADCIKQYAICKDGCGEKITPMVLGMLASRISEFLDETTKAITETDTLDLPKLGEVPTVIYLTSNEYTKFAFLHSILFTQIFRVLDKSINRGETYVPVKQRIHMIMDEFCNQIGEIPDLDKLLTISRKYNISCMMCMQAISQIQALYKNNWETILASCDTIIYCGGTDFKTKQYICKCLGVDSVDEIKCQKRNDYIIRIHGLDPFLDKKYDPKEHQNAKYMKNN